jgi:hypothetical protein
MEPKETSPSNISRFEQEDSPASASSRDFAERDNDSEAKVAQLNEQIRNEIHKVQDTEAQPVHLYQRLDIDSDIHKAPSLEHKKEQLERLKQEQNELEAEEERKWYEKAKEVAESFLLDLDPELSVRVEVRDIYLYATGKTHADRVLLFEHASNSAIKWSMDIQEDDEYLTHNFEMIVKNIYERKASNTHYRERTTGDYEDVEDPYNNPKLESLASKEREKSEAERFLIAEADYITNVVRERFGLPRLTVPERAVHIIKSEEWIGDGTASYIEGEGFKAILIREMPKLLIVRKKLVHEMLHLKSTNLLPKWLNEAVVERATISLMHEFATNPLLDQEIADSKAVQGAHSDWVDQDGESLFSRDTFLAYLDENDIPHAENFTYREERDALENIMNEVYERSNGLYDSSEDVFRIFVKVALTGDTEELDRMNQIMGEDILKKLVSAGNERFGQVDRAQR